MEYFGHDQSHCRLTSVAVAVVCAPCNITLQSYALTTRWWIIIGQSSIKWHCVGSIVELTLIAVTIVIGVEIIPVGPLVIQPAIVRSSNSCIRSGDHGNDGNNEEVHE